MSSPTPSVSLTSPSGGGEVEEVVKEGEQDKRQGQDEVRGEVEEVDHDYSQDAFEEGEGEDGTPPEEGGGGGDGTKPFSFAEEGEGEEEGEWSEGGVVDSEDVDLQLSLSLMSTIPEEQDGLPSSQSHGGGGQGQGQSFPQSQEDPQPPPLLVSPDSRVPEELQGLQHHFEGGGGSGEEEESGSPPSRGQEEEEPGVEALMRKLQMLEETQKLLENALDANNSAASSLPGGGAEEMIQQALAQLNVSLGQTQRRGQGQDEEEEEMDASLRQEVNSLRRLLDMTLDDETDPGTPAQGPGNISGGGSRRIEDVFEEYEELERSLREGESRLAESGDDVLELSFRSDVSKSKPRPPPPPTFPWKENNNQLQQQNKELSEFDKRDQIGTEGGDPSKKLRLEESTQPHPHPTPEVYDPDPTLLDPNQFRTEYNRMKAEEEAIERERSRTKTLHKNKSTPNYSPTATKSLSTPSLPHPHPPASVSNKGLNKGSPYSSARPRPSLTLAKASSSTGSLPSSTRLQQNQGKDRGQIESGRRGNDKTRGEGDENSGLPPPPERGGGGGGGGMEEERMRIESINWKWKMELDQEKEKVTGLERERVKQEALLQAYQEDNQKLYGALKTKESVYNAKELEWEELINSLKTEIATLKIQRFVSSPSRPGSASTPTQQNKSLKGEVERVKEESAAKSQQILDLRKEIVTLRNNLSEAQEKVKTPSKKGNQVKALALAQEKEKEAQRQVKGLTKQVRTLQRILYNKDPTHPAASAALNLTLGSRDDLYSSQEGLASTPAFQGQGQGQIAVLENRVLELERNLAQADMDGRERLKDFQNRLNSLKSKYDEQLQETELLLQESESKLKLAQNSASSAAVAELTSKLERSSGEIVHLKTELGRARRELEIAAKSSLPPNNAAQVAKGDAATLALALKSFKSELAEKEREVLRLRKDVGELQRTNGTLKREREKYLGGGGSSGGGIPGRIVNRPMHPGGGGGGGGNVNIGLGRGGANHDYFGGEGGKQKTGISSGNLGGISKDRDGVGNINQRGGGGPSSRVELLQETLEYERGEFENLLSHKKKEIEEKDGMIKRLRQQLKQAGDQIDPDQREDDLHQKDALLAELSTRLKAQNELILRLKETLSHFRGLEAELTRTRSELGSAVTHIDTLHQKLQLAQEFSTRPENEILSILAQKFESLNARYLQREQQMETLLNQLSVRTGVSLHPISTNQTNYCSGSAAALSCPGDGIRSGGFGGGIGKPGMQTSDGGGGIIEELLKMGVQTSSGTSSSASSGELDLRQLSPSLYQHLFSGGGHPSSSGRSGGSDIPEV